MDIVKNPSLGQIVLYCLTTEDAQAINLRRTTGESTVRQGEIFPMIITRVNFDNTGVWRANGQVILDGSDTFWVEDAGQTYFTGTPGFWRWPEQI